MRCCSDALLDQTGFNGITGCQKVIVIDVRLLVDGVWAVDESDVMQNLQFMAKQPVQKSDSEEVEIPQQNAVPVFVLQPVSDDLGYASQRFCSNALCIRCTPLQKSPFSFKVRVQLVLRSDRFYWMRCPNNQRYCRSPELMPPLWSPQQKSAIHLP